MSKLLLDPAEEHALFWIFDLARIGDPRDWSEGERWAALTLARSLARRAQGAALLPGELTALSKLPFVLGIPDEAEYVPADGEAAARSGQELNR